MRKFFNLLLLAAFITAILIASRWVGQQAYDWMPLQGTAEAQQATQWAAQASWWSYPPVSLQNPSGQILRLKDEIFRQHLEPRSSRTLQCVAGAVIGAIVAKKVLDVMKDGEPVKNKQ